MRKEHINNPLENHCVRTKLHLMTPKVFISYSWSNQAHQNLVREWSERLLADGVDVVLDLYELKEGHDKFAYMERMVTDPNVTHVLVICDKSYAEKADARVKGVGTESQIISKEVYEQVAQSKFIPIVCGFAEDGSPYLPAYLKSRIWIDFSSLEAVNGNWERLIRLLFNKPLNEKPKLGKPPVYVTTNAAAPPSPARAKFDALRQTILQGKGGIDLYRTAFVGACMEYVEAVRVRQRPTVNILGAQIVEECGKLVPVRDQIIDWVLFEAAAAPSEQFTDALVETFEELVETKPIPAEMNEWGTAWAEAHRLFVYETFLYLVAALIKARAYGELHDVFASHYLAPATMRSSGTAFIRFGGFYAHCDALNSVLAPAGKRLLSPAAALLKKQAQREDLTFADVMQADLMVLMMAFITPDVRWYPQTLLYSQYGNEFPFFLRCSAHKNFMHLATITGIKDADSLRAAVKAGHERLQVAIWHDFIFERDFGRAMNMDKLDTLK